MEKQNEIHLWIVYLFNYHGTLSGIEYKLESIGNSFLDINFLTNIVLNRYGVVCAVQRGRNII